MRMKFLRILPLTWASTYGRKEVVELLLARGADVNLVGEKGHTSPLTTAVFRNGFRSAPLYLTTATL